MDYGITLIFTLFSADELAWKPYPEIFERAVNKLGLNADEVVYIGDNLFFDVHGGQQADLKTVWIEQPEKWWPSHA